MEKIKNPLTGRMIDVKGQTAKVLNTKIQASKKLQAIMRRQITTKPVLQPPKKYGWEDLDEGVKGMITGYVKKNKNRQEIIKEAKEKLKGYKRAGYTKMSDEDLYNWVYGGELDKQLAEFVLKDKIEKAKKSFKDLYKENDNNFDVSSYMNKKSEVEKNVDMNYYDGKKLYNFVMFNNDNIKSSYAYMDEDDKKYLFYETEDGDWDISKFIFQIEVIKGSRLSGVYYSPYLFSKDYNMNEMIEKKGLKKNNIRLTII